MLDFQQLMVNSLMIQIQLTRLISQANWTLSPMYQQLKYQDLSQKILISMYSHF